MADYRVGRIDAPDLPVARAVAASSAFPPVLSPVMIDTSRMAWQRIEGADLYGDVRYRGVLQLTDGGAYDNLGLETVDDFSVILVSDAGAPFNSRPTSTRRGCSSRCGHSTSRPNGPVACASGTSSIWLRHAIRKLPIGASIRRSPSMVCRTHCRPRHHHPAARPHPHQAQPVRRCRAGAPDQLGIRARRRRGATLRTGSRGAAAVMAGTRPRSGPVALPWRALRDAPQRRARLRAGRRGDDSPRPSSIRPRPSICTKS